MYAADENFREAYLESHAVDEKGRILEGKPLRQETIEGMVSVFFDEQLNNVSITGMLPGNLLHFQLKPGGNYRMIWFRPAEVRHIYFSDGLHIPSGKAWVPPILYRTDGKCLEVFALPDDLRPSEVTRLLLAPFHNVDIKGKVCLGSAKVKKPGAKTYGNLIQYWEDLFWLSEFSHLAGNANPTKTNLALLWKRLMKEKKLAWTGLDELQEMKGMTLKKLL